MKTNLVRAALACAALAFTSTAAFATVTPISGTDVGLEHCGGDCDDIIFTGTTDANGSVTFRDLKPGKYMLVIDGPGLVAAMDRLVPSKPAKKSGGSLGLSVGGMFGGGSSNSSSGHEGTGPVGGGTTHSSSSSSGGVGVGLSVPIGGDKGSDQPGYPITNINILLPGNPDASVSFEAPYCRETASKGMRIGFTVPEGASSVLVAGSFGYKWANNK